MTVMSQTAPYDVEAVRADFPIFRTDIRGKPLAFLDSGASAQKPQAVLDAMNAVYTSGYANVHRGAYLLSERATAAFEGSREIVRRFINARSVKEIVYTRNATEGINLVATSYGRKFLKQGDAVLISEMEHHANIVPWQLLREQIGIELRIVPIADDGSWRMDEYKKRLDGVKLVALTHTSNVLGTVTPAKEITALAHAAGAKVLLDGSQAVVHRTVDMQDIDCDFYVFTGHKLYGPTGIGVLYGKAELLESMPPYQGGGDMIRIVTFEKSTWADLPHKFEAGTPAIVEAVGLGAAIQYIEGIGIERIAQHETQLLNYATQRLSAVPGLNIQGTAAGKAGVISFTLDSAHPHDISTIVDRAGVAIRAGHHCAQPLMQRLGVPATARASLAMYSTKAEIDRLADALDTVVEMFS
ncbi:MAG: cysteine desulfurase [Alphaproteobacteria bacterium]|nr:cysteine desulfurase [Alphaproteobacteria bacterium]MBU0798988.1 cysteine desulfurase [Alphaproteobacteria bacterium]MBU0887743.1 cysteine desulfurase [Alphaproteobacteria bacterium]MBU1815034.1 cysteine desulfurase [Alphaproteobacteria bacterium]